MQNTLIEKPFNRSSLLAASRVAILALVFLAPFVRAGEAPAPKVTAEQISAWIKQLGDQDFAARNAAEVKLAEAGAVAETALGVLKDSKDAEIHARVGRLLSGIKIEKILKAAETAMSGPKSIEGDLLVVMSDRNVKAHIKCLPDGKHFLIDQTGKHGAYKEDARIMADGEAQWMDFLDQVVSPGKKRTIGKISFKAMEKTNVDTSRNPLDQSGDLRLFLFNEPSEMKLGDDDVYVLEGALKPGVTSQQRPGSFVAASITSDTQARIYFLKSNGMVRKMEFVTTRNNKGTEQLTMEIFNVKFVDAFDAKVFVYTPPADSEVKETDVKSGSRIYYGWAFPYSRY